MIIRDKEDIRRLLPSSIDNEFRYEEDPENSVIRIMRTKGLGYDTKVSNLIEQLSGKYQVGDLGGFDEGYMILCCSETDGLSILE